MKKALIFLAEGFEEVEALTPVDLLRRAGVEVKMLSVDNKSIVKGAHGIEVKADDTLNNANLSDVELLILPGGKLGTENLDASKPLAKLLSEAVSNNKLIAAICAAPSVLGHQGLLKNKKATCYPGFENELEGAEFVTESVVVDGNIITSRGMGTAMDFGLKLAELLMGSEISDNLSEGIIYEK